MTLNDGQFISGATSAENSDTFQAFEAGSDTTLEPRFHEASGPEIDRACEAAEAAFEDYRALAPQKRARLLETIADRLDARAEDFAERTTRETGLPEGRIRGELGRTTGQLRLFAEVVRQGDFFGVRIDSEGGADVRQYRVPMGPVAVFAVVNFPLAFSVAGGDTASALAAGCPVVVKAHPGHPATSAIVAEEMATAIGELDIPAGVFSLVQGESHAVGERLVRHPAIRAVGFTGSFQGGTALARIAADRPEPIPVFAEMGSINPLFLLPQALGERGEEIAKGFVGSLTMGTGQFCTNPGVVFAVRGEGLEQFVRTVGSAIEAADAGVMLHPKVLSGYEASLKRLDGLSDVEQVAAGKKADKRAQTRLYRTTLATLQQRPETLEEVFGPTSLIVEVPDEASLVQAAEAVPGQLTITVHASADELAQQNVLMRALERRAGRLLFGGFPTGVRVCHAMVHGGPYPSTTSYGQTTSVGTRAIERFLRLVCYQDYPQNLLPEPLRDSNPLKLRRFVNGAWQT